MGALNVVEICAGAGGQALGLELAGFEMQLAVELDSNAAETLTANRPAWDVRVGDVADTRLWDPQEYAGVDLLAGGVPCPPFSVAGRQLGAADERDLFSWAVSAALGMRPRALLLENVRGLALPRFAGYRQHVVDRLEAAGYWSAWRLLHASDFGVPQLRPRFVLVAMRSDDAAYFEWPAPVELQTGVGETLEDLISSEGWPGAEAWVRHTEGAVAPTIVGGSKRHGGADLGPTRAKAAWSRLRVDAHGIADGPPTRQDSPGHFPRLTTEMVARLQGWLPPRGREDPYNWTFTGRKTPRYRQIGNALPPPFARAVGSAIASALSHEGSARRDPGRELAVIHDPVYRVLQTAARPLSVGQIARRTGMDESLVMRRVTGLANDFFITESDGGGSTRYSLAGFRGFSGETHHPRHLEFHRQRAKIS